MSYDDTRTAKIERFGNISVSIEGGAYAPEGEQDDDGYWSEDESLWEWRVEVVDWSSGHGVCIRTQEGGSVKELEPIFKKWCDEFRTEAKQ